jgi:hypothetical protein
VNIQPTVGGPRSNFPIGMVRTTSIVALLGQGTSLSSIYIDEKLICYNAQAASTNTGTLFRSNQEKPVSQMVLEFRQLSGFTWDQIAGIFCVSRQSIHSWASGSQIKDTNLSHLREALSIMEKIDRGSIDKNRLLFSEKSEEFSIVEMFKNKAFGNILNIFGKGVGRISNRSSSISEGEWNRKRPPSPESTVDALQDKIHEESKVYRVGKSIKVKRINETT